MVRTFAHDVAHHQLAQHISGRDDLAFATGEGERIAESAAYLVCSHFGLETGARAFPYIALWSQKTEVLKRVLTTVQRVSCKMFDRAQGDSGGEEG